MGVGGTFDSTNIVPRPIVTGVSSLGIDHVFVLGKTIPEIATQKGGIYKVGVVVFRCISVLKSMTLPRAEFQHSRSLNRRRDWTFYALVQQSWARRHLPSFRSSQNSIRYRSVRCPSLEIDAILTNRFRAGLAGAHQKTNASLAIALVQAFLASSSLPPAFSAVAIPSAAASKSLPSDLISPSPLSNSIVEGLKNTRWPGRCQIAADTESESLKWFLDGAHTVESIACCAEWFRTTAMSPTSSSVSRAQSIRTL